MKHRMWMRLISVALVVGLVASIVPGNVFADAIGVLEKMIHPLWKHWSKRLSKTRSKHQNCPVKVKCSPTKSFSPAKSLLLFRNLIPAKRFSPAQSLSQAQSLFPLKSL